MISAHRPFFSIILPTFNRAKLIEPAIKSVIAQTFTNWELIIVDDGSTDETAEVVKKFQSDKIHYFWKKNQERGIARNFGVNKSKGGFICFLDSDDYYLPHHLQHLYNLSQEKKGVFFQTSYQVRTTSNELLFKRILPETITVTDIAKCNFLSMNGLCLQSAIARQFPFPADSHFLIGEDHYLWLTLLSRYHLVTSPVITTVVVEHDSKTMNTLDPDKLLYSIAKINELMQEDMIFQKACPFGISRVVANWYATAAYFSLRNGERSKGLQLLWQTFKYRPLELLKVRTLSMIYRFFRPAAT